MHTILHIGAGQAKELPDWLATGAERIILVEPNPDLAEQLCQKSSAEPNVTVVEAAITSDPTNNQLTEYNLPEAASLHGPTGLKTFFPGLKTIATHSVATLSPEQLLADHGPTDCQPAMLVLQTPGEEHAIIQALINTNELRQFSQVHLAANPEPCYQGSAAAEQTLQLLVEYGYDITEENHQDPDWPIWQLVRDPHKDKIAALEEAKQVLQEQLADKDSNLTKLAKERDALKTQAEEQQQQHQAELAKHAEQAKELDQRITNAEQARIQAEQSRAEEIERHQASEQKLKSELEVLSQQAEQLAPAREALTKEQNAHKETIKALEDHKQWFRNRKVQAEELQAENAQLKHELDQLKAVLEETKQEKQQLLQSQATGQSALSQLEQKMEQLFNQQAGQVQQAANALGQHVTRSFRDQRQRIQSVTSLEHYFETGAQPLEFGHWAIGADLGSHLVRAIEQNNYDLIIEFGSGTSTLLLARSVLKRSGVTTTNTKNKSLEYDSKGDTNDGLASYDLPQRILSFEQNKAYQQKTEAALVREGLSNLVDLVLAPIVPTAASGQHSNNNTLFYDCNTRLARIAQLYEGRQARLLVLVDGPHSPEGNRLVREPALGCILQYLSAHHLDIVLDDTQRQGEQQVIQTWQQTCQQRGLGYQYQTLNTENGAAWLTIAP